ncbi:MAG TPA: VOC family protein [Thermoanaerobaculia bacterium]|nr:VOC family protein [Thermoanaerobaculia bacterium]
MVRAIPEGYHTVTPYLMVDDLGRLVEFVERAFGATTFELLRDNEGKPRHAEVQIGDSRVMLGQARDEWPARQSTLYLYVEDTDAMYRDAMAAGAKTIMEPVNQFYGDRNAGVEDPAGNLWWIATHVEDVSPKEMERRLAERERK